MRKLLTIMGRTLNAIEGVAIRASNLPVLGAIIIALDHFCDAIVRLPTMAGKLAPRAPPANSECGAIDLGMIMMMGIGMVFLAVGFLMFPIVTDATDDLLSWTCTANTSTTDATYTGFTDVVGITPLLVLIGFLAAGVFAMYLGVQIARGAGSTKLDMGALILLAVAMVFIAVALIILPVVLESICEVLSNNSGAANTGQGLNTAYAGLEDLLLVTPLLLLISFVAGAVITGFFGIKKLTKGG